MANRHDVSSADAMQRLIDGNKRYMEDSLSDPKIKSVQRYEFTEGQSPFAIILNCADSRVVPEMVFDKGIGVVRNPSSR